MLQIFIRFLTMNVISDHPAVYWGLAGVWAILLAAAFSSLHSLRIPPRAKLLWGLLILLLPLLGLAVYALRCLVLGNWSFFKPLLSPPKTARKIAPR